VPHFRTALHFGAVVSAEMGWSSRQIRTQGEAVEIAGRLAQSCPKLKENFLVSEPAMDRLVLPAGSRIHRSVAAQIPGSETNMRLYALEQIEK
jgi:class 3 adenylate cyclase